MMHNYQEKQKIVEYKKLKKILDLESQTAEESEQASWIKDNIYKGTRLLNNITNSIT